jgi:hypothetical protein
LATHDSSRSTRSISRSAITVSTDAVRMHRSGGEVTGCFTSPGQPAIRRREHTQFRAMQSRANFPRRRQASRPESVLLELKFLKLEVGKLLPLIRLDSPLEAIPAVVLTIGAVAEVTSVDSHQLYVNSSLAKSVNEFCLDKSKLPQSG